MSETDKNTTKWYHKPAWIIIAILAAGPFALPLVWFSPALNKWLKTLITIATILITVWILKEMVVIYRLVLKEMAELQSIGQ